MPFPLRRLGEDRPSAHASAHISTSWRGSSLRAQSLRAPSRSHLAAGLDGVISTLDQTSRVTEGREPSMNRGALRTERR